MCLQSKLDHSKYYNTYFLRLIKLYLCSFYLISNTTDDFKNRLKSITKITKIPRLNNAKLAYILRNKLFITFLHS